MSFFHSGPLGRVATEPKTSESEGVLRLCRQPVSECAGAEDDRPSGTDETAMLTILRYLHNLVANNLQLHGRNAPHRLAVQKNPRILKHLGRMGTFAAGAD